MGSSRPAARARPATRAALRTRGIAVFPENSPQISGAGSKFSGKNSPLGARAGTSTGIVHLAPGAQTSRSLIPRPPGARERVPARARGSLRAHPPSRLQRRGIRPPRTLQGGPAQLRPGAALGRDVWAGRRSERAARARTPSSRATQPPGVPLSGSPPTAFGTDSCSTQRSSVK